MELANQYYEILKEWNEVHRLTGSVTQFWKNFEDSIYPLGFLEHFDSFVDIGSGAGFPGMALAIAKPEILATLVEPNVKRSSFLRFVTVKLGLKNVKIQSKKIQDIKNQTFDLVVSRAVADVSSLLDWSTNIRNQSSKILLYKGEQSANASDARILNYETIKKDERIYLYIKECKC
jgi:16S rRNA (guanine527-N7)-methyltransferase